MQTFRSRTAVLVAALVLTVPAMGHAQAAADTTVRDSAKVALIHELLAQTHAADRAVAAMEAALPAQRAANPRIPAVFWDRFIAEARARRGDLVELIVPVYDRHFSTDDVRQLLAFYRTPIGQKLLDTQPAVFQESMAAGQELGRQIGAEVAQQLLAEGVRIEP